MAFGDQLNRFRQKVDAQQKEIFTGVVDLAHESIQLGSPITGAPGQPVGQDYVVHGKKHIGGTLRASWIKSFSSPTEAEISTNVVYARPIEEGVGPHGAMHVRSTVGGFHSVKMTIAAWGRIVATVTERVRGG